MNKSFKIISVFVLAVMVLAACAPAATPAATTAPTVPVTAPTMAPTTAPTTAPTMAQTTAPTTAATPTTAVAGATATAVPPTAAPTASGTVDCGGAKSGDQITFISQWTGVDGALFNNIIAPFVQACGVKIVSNPTRDAAVLDAAVKSTPPDVLFWPDFSPLTLYTSKLLDLSTLGVDPSNYASSWVKLGTVNGKLLTLPAKTDIKTLIWYSPTQFEANVYDIPTSLAELQTLVDKMVANGQVPWATGFGSGAATGWTGMDFIEDIMLAQQGPDFVSGIINGTVPYNDPKVLAAWQLYIKWASSDKTAVGGATGTVNTAFGDALLQPFSEPPKAMMVRQSGFTSSNILATYPNLKFSTDFDFFLFPGAQGMATGSDYMYAFSDSAATKAFLAYLTGPIGAENWARAGFDIDPNKNANGKYLNPIIAKKADILANAKGVVPTIGDTIPQPFGTDCWKAIIAAVQGGDIQTQLNQLETVQMQALGK